MTCFAFDVDGTLTPSRGRIDEEFRQFFLSFCKSNNVYLVTGSDYEKTEEQLGKEICLAVNGIFNCAGNIYTRKGVEIYRNEFTLNDRERKLLDDQMKISSFVPRTGNHIEERTGLVNFSIVGRNANQDQRKLYVLYDEETEERNLICQRLNKNFDRLEAVVGGETGIDIFLRGKDKRQILEHIEAPVIFFGDKCIPGGNDYTIALASDLYYNVKDWKETYSLLKEKYHDDVCEEANSRSGMAD